MNEENDNAGPTTDGMRRMLAAMQAEGRTLTQTQQLEALAAWEALQPGATMTAPPRQAAEPLPSGKTIRAIVRAMRDQQLAVQAVAALREAAMLGGTSAGAVSARGTFRRLARDLALSAELKPLTGLLAIGMGVGA